MLLFSYGSGAVATAFCLEGRAPSGHNSVDASSAPFTLVVMVKDPQTSRTTSRSHLTTQMPVVGSKHRT